VRFLWHWALVALFFVALAFFGGVPLDLGWFILSAFFGWGGAFLWADLDDARAEKRER
jgi:hypothetical protein